MTSDINIPYYRQEHAKTCGLAVLRMVLAFLGEEVSEKDLILKVKVHSFGTFSTDFAAIPLTFGYKVVAYTYNLPMISPLGVSFGTKITPEHLERIKSEKHNRMLLESWENYLKAGGELVWDYPRTQLLENNLPGIISVNTAGLNKFYRNVENGHYFVVEGVDDKNVFVVDPDPTDGRPKYSIAKSLLLSSWILNAKNASDYLMVIKK